MIFILIIVFVGMFLVACSMIYRSLFVSSTVLALWATAIMLILWQVDYLPFLPA